MQVCPVENVFYFYGFGHLESKCTLITLSDRNNFLIFPPTLFNNNNNTFYF